MSVPVSPYLSLKASVRAFLSVPFYPCLPVHDFQSVTFCSVALPIHALTDPVLSCPPCPGGADEAGDEGQE
jgi:hypothetical protein